MNHEGVDAEFWEEGEKRREEGRRGKKKEKVVCY